MIFGSSFFFKNYAQKIRIKIIPITIKLYAIWKVTTNVKTARYLVNATYIGDGIISTHSIDLLHEKNHSAHLIEHLN
jgi:hypothetical protein